MTHYPTTIGELVRAVLETAVDAIFPAGFHGWLTWTPCDSLAVIAGTLLLCWIATRTPNNGETK